MSYAALYVLLAGLLASSHGFPPALLLKLSLPLLVYLFVWLVVFGERAELTPSGITQTRFFIPRTLRWEQVQRIRYRAKSYNKGYSYPTWITLYPSQGRPVVLNSKYKDFERVEAALREHLDSDRMLSKAEEEGTEGWRGMIGAPSWEDVPEILLGLGLLAASISYGLSVLHAWSP